MYELYRYSDIIKSFSWKSCRFEEYYKIPLTMELLNMGRSLSSIHHVVSVSPNFLNYIPSEYIMMGYLNKLINKYN
jgi:hypothetical protein